MHTPSSPSLASNPSRQQPPSPLHPTLQRVPDLPKAIKLAAVFQSNHLSIAHPLDALERQLVQRRARLWLVRRERVEHDRRACEVGVRD